jgi:hypothetical protein
VVNDIERADPHGIVVRRTSSPAPRAAAPVKRSIRVNPTLIPAWSASIYCEI